MNEATARFMLPTERFLRQVIRPLWNLAGGDALQNSGRSLPRLGKAIVRSQECSHLLRNLIF